MEKKMEKEKNIILTLPILIFLIKWNLSIFKGESVI